MYIFDDIMAVQKKFSYHNDAAYYHSYHDIFMYPLPTKHYEVFYCVVHYPVPI